MGAICISFGLERRGWNVPASCRDRIGGEGSHLERYSGALHAVEIDKLVLSPASTRHLRALGARHAERLSVKVPETLTHATDFDPATVDRFIGVAWLRPKSAVLLVQLPPARATDARRRLQCGPP
jgi:uncharacterized protein YecE (DUF72 family)